jgi:hypothetical protein
MMVTYEVAFAAGFVWEKGGKLPGLRGGPSATGCSGGNQPDGSDCFSTRIMWRAGGDGEVYAYIQRANNICNAKNVTCNKDYGVSFSRGAFRFTSGQWNRITLLVVLNDPPTKANGQMTLFYNDAQVFNQYGLQFRTSSDVNVGGFYFSTFFGGDDATWSTVDTTHTYFRNIQIYGGSSGSSASAPTSTKPESVAERRTWVQWSVWISAILLPLFLFVVW